jgi:lipid-A-disaccharide synthase
MTGGDEPDAAAYKIFLIAGEHSGDALGGKLMSAVKSRVGERVKFRGVGGDAMAGEGLTSLFPLADVAVMGPVSILKRLPKILNRVYGTVASALDFEPDAVVIIDSPEFTHPIAKRIRKRRPDIPILDYVSPSVWAWRSGRARKMRAYVDHVLALFPFEPDAHKRLGGPPCSYVGHPLIERLDWLRSLDVEPLRARLGLEVDRPVVVVLPGSRPSEVGRLMEPFGDALRELCARGRAPQVIVPVVASVRTLVEDGMRRWPVRPHLVDGEEDKFRAFKLADAALAASGTVTLELALAGTPMVVAYRVDPLATGVRYLLNIPSIVLPNLVLGENVFPECIQEICTGDRIADELVPLLSDTSARATQLKGIARLPGCLEISGASPSDAAANIVLALAASGRPS